MFGYPGGMMSGGMMGGGMMMGGPGMKNPYMHGMHPGMMRSHHPFVQTIQSGGVKKTASKPKSTGTLVGGQVSTNVSKQGAAGKAVGPRRALPTFREASTSPMAKDVATSPMSWRPSPKQLKSSDKGITNSQQHRETSPGVLSAAETPDKATAGDGTLPRPEEDELLEAAGEVPSPNTAVAGSWLETSSLRTSHNKSPNSSPSHERLKPLSEENLDAHILHHLDGWTIRPDAYKDVGFVTPRQAPASHQFPRVRTPCTRSSGGWSNVICGLGITFSRDDSGKMTIYRIIKGGGADLCGGVHVGDVLAEIDGEDVANMDPASMAPLLVGLEGSRVLLGVHRPPSNTLLRYYVVRCQPGAGKRIAQLVRGPGA